MGYVDFRFRGLPLEILGSFIAKSFNFEPKEALNPQPRSRRSRRIKARMFLGSAARTTPAALRVATGEFDPSQCPKSTPQNLGPSL